MGIRRAFILILLCSTASAYAASPKASSKAAPKPAAKAAPVKAAASTGGDVAAMKRALASTGGPARPADPAKMDPNAALEIRGQSRTLSMMLVLKGGKESINFIKVRKDYHDEILATPY